MRCLEQTTCLYQEPPDPLTKSLFPNADAFLAKRRHEDLLRRNLPTQSRNHTDLYRSLLDHLLCALKPEFETACVMFYANQGPSLAKTCTANELKELQRLLMYAMMSLQLFEEQTIALTWDQKRTVILMNFPSQS